MKREESAYQTANLYFAVHLFSYEPHHGGKLDFCIYKNKEPGQLVRYLPDSTIPLLPKSEVARL